jgi:hypothetical protein
MKKLLIFCLILGFQKTLMAQCDIAQKLVSMTPASINIGQTADFKFTIANDGTGNCSYPIGAVKVVLSIPSVGYSFQAITAPVAGQGQYFKWMYNATKKVVIGTNHTALPVGATESNIIIQVLGVSAAKASANLNISIIDGSDNLSTSNDPSSSTLIVSAAPLPVRLVSFEGKPTPDGNKLTWKTSSEQNFSHYEVEKSKNSKEFTAIGKVSGANNTKENLTYNFLDKNSAVGPSAKLTSLDAYYRLKMVDLDGSIAYSKTIFIKNENNFSKVGEFFPNPAFDNEVAVKVFSNGNTNWKISTIDLLGITLNTENRTLNEGENILKVKLDGNRSGVSIIRFENADGAHVRKVYKQ